jgi:ribosome-binding protein aMBF1 (putative translation factor)
MRSGGGRRGPPATTHPDLGVYLLINYGKMRSSIEAKDVRHVAQAKRKKVSPVGSPVAEAAGRRARRSPGYREAQERLTPYEQLARIVIRRRMELGLTQEQLAGRMGTSHSAISRIESGQHGTSVQTLQRLAAALEMRFVMGFEHGPADKPVRELVSA